MNVDLKVKNPSRREALAVLTKGTVLSIFAAGGYMAGFRTRDKVAALSVPAVMIVTKDGEKVSKGQGQVINSRAVARACKELGLEFRMYKESSDLFQEDEWVKQMHRQALDFGCPCIVIVSEDGSGRCYEIPQTISDALYLIGATK
jgi:hypothetical protein